MTALDSDFVAAARANDTVVTFRDRTIRFSRSHARSGLISAELSVHEDEELLGYITAYTADEHGAVKANLFGKTMPVVFRDLGQALAEIVD